MKKKCWKQTTFAIFAFFAMSIIASFCVTSFATGIAYAGSRNGGLMYVGNYTTYGITDGTTLSGATATNGGGVYVNTGGTLNISGGAIYGNTATSNGNNIYNEGTTNITGGIVASEKPIYTRVEENGYSYVYFGSYPQTIKASSVTVDESQHITNAAGDKYYLGSDGEYYAKLKANPYEGIYYFSDGTKVFSGREYYFKVEPIKWRILSEDNGQAIILAELILDTHQFYSSQDNRTIDNNTIYAGNYKYSDIRSWLNGYSSTYGEDWSGNGFLQRAFTDSEQEYIQTTLVDNSASTTDSLRNSYACENTNDKVWLLSYQDMINTDYGFNSNEDNYDTMRMKQTSDYSRANYAYCDSSTSYLYNNYWWSRSSYTWSANYAIYCRYSGNWGAYFVDLTYRGVVPALTLSLESGSDSETDYGIYNTGTLNIYGGLVYDHIYSSGTLNTKVGANISGIITLADSATIVVEDYAGVTPTYKINLSSTRGEGTIITFKGSSVEPDLSKLTITGFDEDSFELMTETDSDGISVKLQKKAYTRVGNYIYFGSYPKTIKASSVTVDEKKYITNGAKERYYLGSDGEYYMKVTADQMYKYIYSNAEYTKSVNSNTFKFSDSTKREAGTTYYFKVEPLKWQILSEGDGTMVLFTEDIIDASCFDSGDENNYKNSNIRSYINDRFYNRAFSTVEQGYIKTSTVNNGASTTHSSSSSYTCANTEDKVYLLSYSEGNDLETFSKQVSDYALAVGCSKSMSTEGNYGIGTWWTRSPGRSSDDAWRFEKSGSNNVKGDWYVGSIAGVVPVIKISLTSTSVESVIAEIFEDSKIQSSSSENNNLKKVGKLSEQQNMSSGGISGQVLFGFVGANNFGESFNPNSNLFAKLANIDLFDEKRKNIFSKAKQLSTENVFFEKLKRADYFVFENSLWGEI